MKDAFLIINAGSSSIKFSLFTENEEELEIAFHGEIEGIGAAPGLHVKDKAGLLMTEQRWPKGTMHDTLIGHLIDWIEKHLGPNKLKAAGHRVAHGGRDYSRPVRINENVLKDLTALIPLAPLHQPHNLAPITALTMLHPRLPQVACFDTAFHASNTRLSRLYGLPRSLSDEGILRYGFHGLSYEFISQVLPQYDSTAAFGKTIVAHLGSGASMCAMIEGQSLASTMGFSALDGLLMNTRCGDLDPGVLLYLLQEKQMTPKEIENMLYRQSGLSGVSGIGGDMRDLLSNETPQVREAVDLFVYRVTREMGSLSAAMQGLDALVFTAGIGENASIIRQRVCEQSAWLGITIDETANTRNGPRISKSDSKVSVWVIPTNEEKMIAMHTRDCL